MAKTVDQRFDYIQGMLTVLGVCLGLILGSVIFIGVQILHIMHKIG